MSIDKFSIQFPTQVEFGCGVCKKVGEIGSTMGTKKALLITGSKSVEISGALEKVTESLEQVSIKWVRYKGVKPNPDIMVIKDAIEVARREDVDLIISLGGGSAIDVGKAVSIGVNFDGDIKQLINHSSKSVHIIPMVHIAIPTTAGSGSECSKGSIITDNMTGLKSGLRGNNVFPKYALVDPDLTLTMSDNVTATSGFDAFAHAIESYFSLIANPLTEALSEYVIPRLFRTIPLVLADPKNIDGRKVISSCSMLMGINLGNASTCLPHRLQYAMASFTDVSHGQGLAVFYKAWLDEIIKITPEKTSKIENLLGIAKGELPSKVQRIIKEMGLNKTLSDYTEISTAEALYKRISGNIEHDPIGKYTPDRIIDIIRNSF